MTEKTTEGLVRQAQTGDRAAFEALMSEYEGTLFALVWGMVHHRETVRDLVQEAFLKGWSSLPQLEDPAKFPAWMGRIATNLALKEIQRRKREEAMDELEPMTVSETEEFTAEEQGMAMDAIAELPEHYRSVVVLRYSIWRTGVIRRLPRCWTCR